MEGRVWGVGRGVGAISTSHFDLFVSYRVTLQRFPRGEETRSAEKREGSSPNPIFCSSGRDYENVTSDFARPYSTAEGEAK